jgi:hypothetical protein
VIGYCLQSRSDAVVIVHQLLNWSLELLCYVLRLEVTSADVAEGDPVGLSGDMCSPIADGLKSSNFDTSKSWQISRYKKDIQSSGHSMFEEK